MATLTDPGDLRDDERVSDAHVSSAEMDQIEAYANDPANASDKSGNTVENASEGKIKSTPKESEDKSGTQAAHGRTNAGAKSEDSQPAAGLGKSSKSAGTGASSTSRWSQFTAGINRRRKPLTYVLIGIIISGVLAGGFMSLVPFKLESMIKNIVKNRIESRVRHYVVKRLLGPRNLIKQYMKASVGNDDATFEKNIANLSEPDKQLMRTWRKPPNGAKPLENQLADQNRLVAKREGGTVHFYQDEVHIGSIDDPKVFDLVSNNVFDNTHNFEYFKRGRLRQMAQALYGIKDWIKDHKKTGADAEKEQSEEQIGDAMDAYAPGAKKAIECALDEVTGSGSGNCPTDEGNTNENERTGVVDTEPSKTGNANDADLTQAVQDGQTSAVQKVKDVYNKVADHVLPGRIFGRILAKYLGQEIATKVATAFAAAKGPLLIIAAVDIASRIDHFFWYGTADKVLVNIHKVQYAAQFFWWATADDNRKDGNTVSPDENNIQSNELDGTENSYASKYIYGTAKITKTPGPCDTTAQTLTCVSDGQGGVKSEPFSRSIDENSHPIEDDYRHTLGIDTAYVGTGLHYILEAWYVSLGKIWAVVNSIVGAAFNLLIAAIEHIPGIGDLIKSTINWAIQHIGEYLAQLAIRLVGPAVTGTETGADLMNGIDAGGAVAGMDYARWLGGHMLSPLAAAQVNDEVAVEQRQQNQKLSFFDRVFSTDNPRSLVNVVALQMPTTPSGAVTDSVNEVASIGANPMQLFNPILRLFGMGTAQASDLPNLDYGLNEWGYTDADLAQNDNGKALNQAYKNAQQRLGKTDVSISEMTLDDCPAVDDPATIKDHPEKVHPNLCRLDLTADQTYAADFTTADDGGLNSP